MPQLDGMSVLRCLRDEGLGTYVLVLTSATDDSHLLEAVKTGALSFLPKTAGVEQVIEAVRTAAGGEAVLQPAAIARLLKELRGDAPDPLRSLTPRKPMCSGR
jgi:NarL family two-component system response regulator LiaR